ncbi:MAG: hypothetical protein LBE36_07455 [Flavobacteriaceae bacterium]|jgi:hypothetical protein|nr:hypothetical protein [Flavobacteriaceae bacterium]
MKSIFKILNKYFWLLILDLLLGNVILYMKGILFYKFPDSAFDNLSVYGIVSDIIHYTISLIIIVLLIIDFGKYKLKNTLIACISALFSPLLGVVIFIISYLIKEKNEIAEQKYSNQLNP